MKFVKILSILSVIVFVAGCNPGKPQWIVEREERSNRPNKLTLINSKLDKPLIVIENVKDFYSNGSGGYISYKKDDIEYEYKGDYLFEVDVESKTQE